MINDVFDDLGLGRFSMLFGVGVFCMNKDFACLFKEIGICTFFLVFDIARLHVLGGL